MKENVNFDDAQLIDKFTKLCEKNNLIDSE